MVFKLLKTLLCGRPKLVLTENGWREYESLTPRERKAYEEWHVLVNQAETELQIESRNREETSK